MIGDSIRQLRVAKGLSISELADRANVAKSYISSIERGIQKNPSIQTLDKIARVLGVTTQQLLSLDDQPQAPDMLDEEWLELAKQMAASGISKEQFREFLEFHKWRRQEQSKNTTKP
jgi:XRE family transcriptional regulator, master regulator for biofilm formation